AKVELVHVNTDYFTNGVLDTEKLDLVGRMGENWYIRAIRESLFEIPKPIGIRGIGVDALPEGIRQSRILTGNNLGRLGNLESLPTAAEIEAIVLGQGIANLNVEQHHLEAQRTPEAGDVHRAMAYLLYAERLEDPMKKNIESIFKAHLQPKEIYRGGSNLPPSDKKIHKLSSNENPLGRSPKAVAAIKACLDRIDSYPDQTDIRLREALARDFGGTLDPDRFITGNSGSEILDLLIRAFLHEGDQ